MSQILADAYRVDGPINMLWVCCLPSVCTRPSSRFRRVFTTIPWLGHLPVPKQTSVQPGHRMHQLPAILTLVTHPPILRPRANHISMAGTLPRPC